ncbi:MAG: chemotaxis response regulator protein-glutamate methylesterase [Rhodospirillales bacterium]|nr:chemotaxis response regulator protein-glutamate methylesterase [Rhodospirillales bacterium]
MLVDDSAVIRGALSRILEEAPDIKVVASVANGEMGIGSARKYQPHIVILDIEMPIMDGIVALPKILEASPNSKVIMFSSLTEKGADISLKALSLGAVECIVKPSSASGVGQGSEFQKNLLATVRGLVPQGERTATAGVRPTAPAAPAAGSVESFSLRSQIGVFPGKPAILAIGSSTGGPQALFEVIKSFKGFDIPIVITQHMPATFTKILAEHIGQQTGVEAHEGAEGMKVEKGKAYVAPGGHHMKIVKEGLDLVIRLDDGPPENFCKPSVEPMFRSVIDVFGNKVYGLILTGMGNDGIGAGKLLNDGGGHLVAQDKATSVVWGMPGAVAKAGYCTFVLPLNEIGPHIRRAVMGS